jgi:hypothetical protein
MAKPDLCFRASGSQACNNGLNCFVGTSTTVASCFELLADLSQGLGGSATREGTKKKKTTKERGGRWQDWSSEIFLAIKVLISITMAQLEIWPLTTALVLIKKQCAFNEQFC